MKKRVYTTGRLLSILIIFIILLGLFYLIAPKYVSRALIYQKANIDDHKIFDNRKVAAGKHKPWPLKKTKLEIPEHHLKKMKEYDPVAFLISRHDTLICENYWDGYSTSSYSNAFSATKSIVSLMVGIALEKGYIKSLDQSAGDFFVQYSQEEKSEITIKDLLSMSSGLSWDESYGSLFSTTTQAYYGTDIKKLVMDLDVITKPGKEYKYLSGNTQLLGLLLSKVAPETLSELTSDNLWKPIGAKHDALWSLDKKGGYEKAYCCFNSNARDFARIGQLVLDSGKAYGKQVISSDYILKATEPATWLVDEDKKPVDFYGYSWWILNYKGKTIKYARGIKGQYIFVIPAYDAVVVRLGHKRSDEYLDHHPKDVYIYLDAAFDILD
ncbi:MAG: beta-lactamase family protein [Bacteroidales bacterium]|nr:beta-lactamase family protein [Bacteroidales bacterium]